MKIFFGKFGVFGHELPFGNERAYPVLWKQIYMYIFHDSIGYNVKEQTTGLCLCFYFCSLYFYKKVTTPCFYQNIFQMKITPQFTETHLWHCNSINSSTSCCFSGVINYLVLQNITHHKRGAQIQYGGTTNTYLLNSSLVPLPSIVHTSQSSLQIVPRFRFFEIDASAIFKDRSAASYFSWIDPVTGNAQFNVF